MILSNIHFAELLMYEHNLLQPSDDSKSFHATPKYVGW
jgi:hypothetical protein